MKKLILLLLLLAFCGCGGTYTRDGVASKTIPGYIYTTKVGNCEYVVYDHNIGYAGMGGICHKGDCNNPIHTPK